MEVEVNEIVAMISNLSMLSLLENKCDAFTKNNHGKKLVLSENNANILSDVNQAFAILLQALRIKQLSFANYCAEWLLRHKHNTKMMNAFENDNVNYELELNTIDIDKNKIDLDVISKLGYHVFTKNMILLKYDTILDILSAPDAKSLLGPNDVTKLLFADPYLIVDSENTIFQWLDGTFNAKHVDLLSLVRFEKISNNYLKTAIVDNFTQPMQKMLIDAWYVDRTGRSIPRITMKKVVYKAEQKFNTNLYSSSNGIELCIGGGYKFWGGMLDGKTFAIRCSCAGKSCNSYPEFCLGVDLKIQIKLKPDIPETTIHKICDFTDKVSSTNIILSEKDITQTYCNENGIVWEDGKITLRFQLTIIN